MKNFKEYLQRSECVTESITKDISQMYEADVKEMLLLYVTGVKEIESYLNDKRMDDTQKMRHITKIVKDKLKWT